MGTKRRKGSHHKKMYNTSVQYYRGIPIQLIVYTESHFASLKAKRFMLGEPPQKHRQNVWIPNAYLEEDGTLKGWNLDFVFKQAALEHKLKYAGIGIDPFQW